MPPNEDRDVEAFTANLTGAAFYYMVAPTGEDGITVLNRACEEIWSLSSAEIEADPSRLWDMVHPQDIDAMHASVLHSARTLTVWDARFRITDAAGTAKTLLSRGTPEALPDGSVRWLTFLFDVTQEVRTEALFHLVTRQLDHVSDAIPDGFALFDPQERLVVCNRLFRAACGLPETVDARGMSFRQILEHASGALRLPNAEGRAAAWIDATLASFREAASRHEEKWADGRWMRALDRPTEDGGRVSFRIEITESVRRKRELEKAASTDPVTGLLNRRGLALRLPDLRDGLPPGSMLVAMHVDLDKFKAINDAYGHETGDVVLNEIARRLRSRLGPEALIARAGGDEFIAAFAHDPATGPVDGLAEALRISLLEPIVHGARSCRVGATIGFAEWSPGGGRNVEQTLADADTALMSGKAAGRCRTVRFRPEMGIDALHSASLAAKIKLALSEDAFVPFFQPQVAWPEGRVVGLEALARWRRPDGRHDPAATFIHVANETGLVAQIDRMIYGKCLDAIRMLERGGCPRPSVSVNLSAQRLGTDGIVELLLDALFERGLSPASVNIEVLESTLLDSRANRITANINALASAGFGIELDDFGTGHTALASLTTFPVHRIKIDRSLIRGVDGDERKRAVVSGLYLVCDTLGIDAIAEGVETRAELEALHRIGFGLFQGFCFSDAMPADALVDWVGPHAGRALPAAPGGPSRKTAE
ncbi:MAG: putative bifunctional diguanylate cyclase/phosphodiesterase [Roseicyclus sp.]